MTVIRHCRHCAGACAGDCLMPGSERACIHRSAMSLTAGQRLALLRTRAFWRRVFWGVR